MKKWEIFCISLIAVFLLSGCAMSFRLNPQYMLPSISNKNVELKNTISIKSVQGASASAYNYITDAQLYEAVHKTLKKTELLNTDDSAKYKLSVYFVSMDAPNLFVIGGTAITATISYTLKEKDTGKTIWKKTIRTAAETGYMDYARGAEKALKQNLKKAFNKIMTLNVK